MNFEFNVEINNWPKRRRAMMELLNNPRLPKCVIPKLHQAAQYLIITLEEHGHPMCAHIIRMKLIGVNLDAKYIR